MPSAKQIELFREAVVHVGLNVLGRGSPGDMAVICGLTEEERKAWIEAYEGESDEFGLAGEISELQRVSILRLSVLLFCKPPNNTIIISWAKSVHPKKIL